MTREEAINKIRQWSLPKETRDILEALAPELRENEDENLKNKGGYYKAGKFWKASTLWNATKNKIPQRVSNKYILQECTWNIGTLQRFADEVKNVQEVSLNYPIILDMNGNILDGAHRVVKAYLEGKDIDIVYLGDDEWPEPDYDEEKAVRGNDDERVKKSLIKFLTDIKEISESGRTTWAVRKEDAEMCKSFIAWLEKQKEQKDYRKLYEDIAQSEWFKKAYAGKSLGEEFEQKEQRPVERSLEDDHIIGFVYDLLNEIEWKDDWAMSKEECLRLLSNYSPQKITKVTINGKPISTENKSVDIPLAEWSDEDSDNLERVDNYLWMLDDYVGDDCAMSQGKTDEIRGNIQGILSPWLKSLSERFNLQRKVEWSEEDKKMLNHLIDKIQENWHIRMPGGHYFGISNDEKETFSSWLRCLPERFNLQPNQE